MNILDSVGRLFSKAAANLVGQVGGFVDLKTLTQYVNSADDRQNAIDLIPGWNCRLPPQANVNAGTGVLYDDARIHWAIQQFGSIHDCGVLEIGPMEASHTYMLENAGAAVSAVEANKLAFLKCLIAKELLGLSASFFLAETNQWLRKPGLNYDLVVACGVLYHMQDPVTFLELIAGRSNAIYLWTHFVSDEELSKALTADSPHMLIEQRLGEQVRLFPRPYANAHINPSFCGGVFDSPRWMPREDILRIIASLGFDEIITEHEVVGDDVNLPSFSVFARKTGV